MYRFLLSFLVIFAVICSSPAQAGVVGKTLGELGMNEQVQNLGDAVHSEATALAGMVGRGGTDTVRGATGALTELTVNSGELICGAWMISFRVRIRNLIIENASLDGEAQIRHSQLIQRLQEFTDRLERECTRVGLIGIPVNQDANAVATGTDPAPAAEPEPEDDRRIRPREGETIADEICRRRCAQQEADMEREERYLADTERSMDRARQRAQEKQASLEDKQRRLREAQQTEADTRRILRRGTTGSLTPAQQNELATAGQQNSSAQREIERLTPEVERARAELESAQGFVRTVEANLRYQQERTEAARRAYYDCLKRCLDQARAAGDATTLTCPAQYKCAAPSKGTEKSVPDKRSDAAPVRKGKCAVPAAKSVTIGANSQYGSGAQMKNKAKSMATGMAIGGLNSVLGGSGISLGNGGNFGAPGGGGGDTKGPKTVKDYTRGDYAGLSSNGVDLGVRAGLSDDGLVVSQKILESPGDASTFHAMWMEDGHGRQMMPVRYDIYSLYIDHKLTLWWTYDHWTNGVHDAHDEGSETTTWRTGQGDLIRRFGGDAGVQNSIWYQSGFETAVKGVRQIGAVFPVSAEDLAQPCPLSLVTHVTLPEQDPVVTVPFVSHLSIDPAEADGKRIADIPVHVSQ